MAVTFSCLAIGDRSQRQQLVIPRSYPMADINNRSLLIKILSMTSSQDSYSLSPKEEYVHQLLIFNKKWELASGNEYVIADCDVSTGVLLKGKYHLVKRNLVFHSPDRRQTAALLSCNCDDGIIHQKRLQSTNPSIQENFLDFVSSEVTKYCRHSYAINVLFPDSSLGNSLQNLTHDSVSSTVELLQDEPLLAAVTLQDTHLVNLKKTAAGKKLACMTCKYGTRDCEHVEVYRHWVRDQDKESPETDTEGHRSSNFEFISYRQIPHPLPSEMKLVYDLQESGQMPFPQYLVPSIPPSGEEFHLCSHGCAWDEDDPVANGWCIGEAVIFKENCTVTSVYSDGKLENIKVCYRPSVGGCGCKLFYDGGEDLLFNLNNRDFIHYGLLLSYLHLMVEGRNPLAAFHRAYTHKHSQLSSTQLLPLHKLRLGWNGYARLLAINWTESFACGLCGSDPDVVICDGTSLGLHKQLLQGFNEEDVNILPVIQGSKHTDRVYIPSSKARKLLHQFSGLHQQRNLSNLSPTPLNREQYIHLITLLRKFSHLQSLADVIERISNNGNELRDDSEFTSRGRVEDFLFSG
ncbi:uncharacterized protein [Ptychodera flava]|uniref:uncharacterized protein isoform X2 n=1 Tax=Ptychodera flava TaxID=63121 RepID=UPI00396A448B